MIALLLVVLFADVALPVEKSNAPLLRVEFSTRPYPEDKSLVTATVSEYRLVAPDGKKVLWRRKPGDLPGEFLVDKKVAAAYQGNRAAPLSMLAYPFHAALVRKDEIVVAVSGQMFVLARSDGRTVFQAPVAAGSDEHKPR